MNEVSKNKKVSEIKNYGNLTSGFIQKLTDSTIENSVNYGTIGSSTASNVGAFVKTATNSVIAKCRNFGKIIGKDVVGGIAGALTNSAIIDCVNEGEVIGVSFVGGLFGKVTSSRVKQSASYSDITGSSYVAGFGGQSVDSVIRECKHEGNIFGAGSASALVAVNEGEIKNCLNIGNVDGSVSASVFVYKDSGSILNCINIGNYNGKASNDYIGEDFSAFYWSWKTGKIGLKEIDGNGAFQGEVNVEYLQKQGFEGDYMPEEPDSGNDLYSKYTQLEYIESTGTQYIDTEYCFNSDRIRVETTFVPLSSADGIAYFGNQWSPCSVLLYNNANKLQAYIGNIGSAHQSFLVGTKYDVNLEYDGTSAKANINNQSFEFTKTVSAFCLDKSLLIGCCRKASGGMYTIARQKIYNFKIYDNNVLVRSFIPAKRTSDGMLGLYDTVEGKFYMDANGGNFAYKN